MREVLKRLLVWSLLLLFGIGSIGLGIFLGEKQVGTDWMIASHGENFAENWVLLLFFAGLYAVVGVARYLAGIRLPGSLPDHASWWVVLVSIFFFGVYGLSIAVIALLLFMRFRKPVKPETDYTRREG